MNIFMFATHPAVVDHESTMFHALGYNVHTSAWTSGTNAYGMKYEHNPLHFYQGKCDFLGPTELKILSKIDVSWPICTTYPDVGEVLVKNFDVLYVSQITNWLLYYSALFLNAGKKVVFRTFSYGHGNYNWFINLFKYLTMWVVPSYSGELHFYNNLRHTQPTLLAMRKELVDTSLIGDDGYVFSVVNGGDPNFYTHPQKQIEASGAPYHLHNFAVNGWLSNMELTKKFARCRMYVDFFGEIPKSAALDAMLYKKPALLIKNGTLHHAMVDTGFDDTGINWLHTIAGKYQDQVDLVLGLYNYPDRIQKIVNLQSQWQENVTKRTEATWREVLEDATAPKEIISGNRGLVV